MIAINIKKINRYERTCSVRKHFCWDSLFGLSFFSPNGKVNFLELSSEPRKSNPGPHCVTSHRQKWISPASKKHLPMLVHRCHFTWSESFQSWNFLACDKLPLKRGNDPNTHTHTHTHKCLTPAINPSLQKMRTIWQRDTEPQNRSLRGAGI